MEKSEHIETKQVLGFDVFAIAVVFILPMVLIFFSNSIGGTFIGIVFLAFIIYGVVFLYNQLYRKKLLIGKDTLLFENKCYFKTEVQTIKYNQIKNVSVEQGLFNKILNTGKLLIELDEGQTISLINIANPLEIKKIIESNLD